LNVTSILEGIQSALDPHGPEAAGIADITWVMLAGGAVVFVLVVVLTALALVAPRPWLASRVLVVAGGIAFPAVVLGALLVYTLMASPRLAAAQPADVVIAVEGNQWWWRVDYLDAAGQPDFTTANEIRIPVGASVEVRLATADVLHSFWVPALAGKLDLVPGRDHRLRLVADREGRFRGQCAEYCGGPHGLMAIFVIAEPLERFEAWREAQRLPRPENATMNPRGRDLFLSHCASCHTVRGTRAAGTRGPDLTHFASRVSLGAGILPNDIATVEAWIARNQHFKPGNLMPEFRMFSGDELRALAGYLGELR
jgi:cytochrome c oxidase subunit 2